jgi:Fimbrial assembly protein (PilN)
MKVHLNLAISPSRRERYALAWAAPTFALALLIFVYLAAGAVRDFRRSRQVGQSLAEVQSRNARLGSRETEIRLQLEQPKFREMIRETEFVNHLITARQFSLTELTIKVSKLLPMNVKLNGLGLAGTDTRPEVRFAVMGKSEEAVESFLNNLEDSKDFSDVTIRNQGFQGGEGGGPEQVALTCTARYLTAGLPAEQERQER